VDAACRLTLRGLSRRHHVAREHGKEDATQLTPPPSHHESAQIPHLRRETRRVRFRLERHPVRRSILGGDRIRSRIAPQGHGEPHRRLDGRRPAQPELQGLTGIII
jgi:hypothetical protein